MFSGFATRFTARMTALVLVASMLTGCAEIDRRGGVVAEMEDFVLFKADTKSHRLFRSYLLIGVLLAASRQAGHNEVDRQGIEANLKSALKVSFEAYYCLYPPESVTARPAAITNPPRAIDYIAPAACQFFDEKMARLDYALFRLALITLFNGENRAQLTEIRDRLFGSVPVLSDSLKAAVHANKAVKQATTLVDDLLNLSFNSAGPLVILLPLYRDSLELNMWVLIDNLTRACSASPSGVERNGDGSFLRSFSVEPSKVCQTLFYATQIMNDGNGDLRLWREFVRNLNYATSIIDAYEPHFFSITKLMYRSCQSVLGDTSTYSNAATLPEGNKCQAALTNAISQGAMYEYGIKGEYGQIYTAWLRGPTWLARSKSREQPAHASGPREVKPKPDTESTGSIPQTGVPSAPVSR